jgi:hypothetical protein
MNDDLGFYRPLEEGQSRADLLRNAATAADRLRSQMGANAPAGAAAEAQALRDFISDEVRFADRPEVLPLDPAAAVAAAKLPVPIAVDQFAASHRFYMLRFPVDLHPSSRWSFSQLKARVEFNATGSDRPKVQSVFPETKFQDLLSTNASLQLGVRPDLEFSVGTGDLDVTVGSAHLKTEAGLAADVKGSAGISFGPWSVAWKRAIVKASQPGLEWVWWEVSGADLREGYSPPLIVILRVPKAATAVSAQAKLEASRHYNLLKNVFTGLGNLPRVYREFIEAGVPCISAPAVWDTLCVGGS